MTYQAFFAGAGAIVLGVLLGCWITYRFQRRLLEQQLAFLKEQAVEDAKLRRQIYEEWGAVFKEFRNMVNTRFDRLGARLERVLTQREPRPDDRADRKADEDKADQKDDYDD